MCGIAGIISLDNSPVEMTTIQRFTDSLSHRGPDGSGYTLHNDSTVALGHRRLSILDLTEAGKQPMSREGRYTITYNGEVYNFIEIKKELLKEGYRFNTGTDTEVILAAYEKWGLDCFNRFNGMWAMAIYDSTTRDILLCRDRFGVKPLYYAFNEGRFCAFASETIAFRSLIDFNLAADPNMLARAMDDPVLTEGTGRTIWKNIFQLLPGHYCMIHPRSKSFDQRRWFSIPQAQTKLSYEEAKEEFFRLTESAVKLRLRSDVPVATALSGGLDSSSVYAMLYHLKGLKKNDERIDYNSIKGFVATFEGTLQDETEYARAMVDHCKGEAEFLRTDFNSIISSLESSVKLFNDISATPISVLGDVYKSMRLHQYIVSLDGHGVDEMLYGYRSLVSIAINESILQMNEADEKDLTETYADMYWPQFRNDELLKIRARSNSFRKAIGTGSALGKLKHQVKQSLRRMKGMSGDHFQWPAVSTNPFLQKVTFPTLKDLSDRPIELGSFNTAERELIIDFYHRNIPYNMRDFDRAAMQHGVEIRMPFMDYRLVNFVFSLPMGFKVGHGYTKRIMRDSLQSILPEKVCRRKLKIGMGAPIHDWFNQPLNTYIKDTVSSTAFLQSPFWDGHKIKTEALELCDRKSWQLSNAQQFWSILNAHMVLS